MKFLYILMIVACLNMSCAFGMDQSNMMQSIKSATKFVVVSALFIDGSRAALTGKSLLFIPPMEGHPCLSETFNKLIGSGEMLLSWGIIEYFAK